MTVASETNKVTYAGDASTTTFSTAFTFASDDEVNVTLVDSTTGGETAFTRGTQYTLTGAGTGSAGTVTIVTSPTDYTPASGKKLVIQLKPDFLQQTDLPRGGTVSPADTLEPMHDSRVRQMLRLKDELDRAIKVPIDETSASNLPNVTSRAGKILAFDSSGNPEAGDEIGDYKGNWAASTYYAKRDLVKDTSTNNIFRANTSHTSSGAQPLTTNTDSAKWDKIVDAAAAGTSAAAAAASATASAASATSASSSAATATTKAGEASTSATSAASSSASASGFADEADNWARKVDGVVESTDYSSKAWAIGGTGVTDTASRGAAKEWATETSGTVDTSEYSAKEYASGTQSGTGGSAKSWAQTAEDTAVTGSSYSALHHAAKSAASATAAAASAANAAGNAGTQSVDRFNGTGSQTAFTMTASPATENNTAVYISGVYQQKDTYSISGTTLTFSTAPPTGTGNIEVMHMSTLPTGISPTVGTTTTGAAGTNASVSISGHELSFTIPRGDTGSTGAAGQDVTSVTVSAVSPGGSPTASYNSGTGALALGIVTGDTGATGPAGSVAGMADGSAAAPSLAFASDTNTGLFRVGADQLGFTTAGTSAMTIDASQNVAVTGGVDVTGALTVDGNTTLGDASGDSITMNASTVATPNGLNFDSNTLVIDQTNNRVGVATASPAHALHVTGDIYASGNVTAYSSAAAKTNIATIPDALDIVQRLRGVSFDWLSTGKKSHGLIYEEVAEVVPELTSNEGGHVGVAYQNTVAVLIEAVKTLSAKVKELESK